MANARSRKQRPREIERLVGEDPLADAILRAIRRILRKTVEHSRNVFNESGLTVPQLLCLRLIAQENAGNDLTAAELAELVQLSPATISRILDRLDSNELIARSRNPTDRRRVTLKLTRKGRQSLGRLPTPLQEEFLQRLYDLPEKKRKSLLQSLEQVVDMMGASALEVAPVLTTDVAAKPGD